MPFAFSGKSLAYTRVDFTNPTGQLVAYGSGSHPVSSVASLTEIWDQPIRSTLAGQSDMRCAIFRAFSLCISLMPLDLGECQILSRWGGDHRWKGRALIFSDTIMLDIGATTKPCIQKRPYSSLFTQFSFLESDHSYRPVPAALCRHF